jgi:SMC interacting uncharacterized protein involved in chromosome segregation
VRHCPWEAPSFRAAEEETRVQQKKYTQADKVAKMEEEAAKRIMQGVEADRAVRLLADEDAKAALDAMNEQTQAHAKAESELKVAIVEYDEASAAKAERDRRSEQNKLEAILLPLADSARCVHE